MVAAPIFSDKILACLKAPGCDDDADLELIENGLYCAKTGERYAFVNGIPSLYKPNSGEYLDITTKVRSFYEEHPFPSYDGIEQFGDLVHKGYQNPFTVKLLKSIGYNNLILDCGCGTGQLTHFLQLNNNHTLGIDLSLSSLALAMEYKRCNQLTRCGFAQMNIFELAVKDAAFDVVISHGVLHHTFNARSAFKQIVRKVKRGGIIIVGLYNCYGRVPTWLRGKLIGTFGPKIDFVVRSRIRDARKADIWIKDQYYNPHETWHSIDEVLEWFEENDIEFLNANPPIVGTSGEEVEHLFTKTEPGNKAKRLIAQLSWIGTISREGALFNMIGRRKK